MAKLLGRLAGIDPRMSLVPRYHPPHEAKPLNISYEPQFPAVYTQQFNDCVANAVCATLAFYRKKRRKETIIPSRTALYAAAKTENYSGGEDLKDDGLFPSDALEALLKKGWASDADWPYDSAHLLVEPPTSDWIADFPLRGYRSVSPGPVPLRAALIAHGPMCVGFDWPENWMDLGHDGVLPAPSATAAGGHEVVIVGISDTKRAFRIRNSWGTDVWGDKGHAWLSYESPRMPQDAFVLDFA